MTTEALISSPTRPAQEGATIVLQRDGLSDRDTIMKTLPVSFAILAVTILSAATGLAKDKDKDKDKDRDHDRDRDRSGYYDKDRDRDRDHDREGSRRDRTRTLYFIERDRPVQREVYVDGDGRYYRYSAGRRVYVRERYYESYPSKYYYPDGRRRVTITLPF